MSDNKFSISSTPHLRDNSSIERIMLDVLIALAPACVAAAYFFGLRAIAIMILSMASCLFSESLFNKIIKKPDTTRDYSALVTGLLLAMNLPVSVPFWIPIIGGMFAIIIVKMLFGGIGQNFMNPALAARAFLQISFAGQMINFTAPVKPFSLPNLVDTVSSATQLSLLKTGEFYPATADYINAFVGNIPGSLGETSALALLIGGAYLMYRKVITWRTPLAFLSMFSVLVFVFGRNGLFTGLALYEMLLGGVILGALFMATDYSSSPITPMGQVILGFGCGILTFVIRVYGGYPEGVCYAILIINLCVPLIDRFCKPKVYGVTKPKGGAKHA